MKLAIKFLRFAVGLLLLGALIFVLVTVFKISKSIQPPIAQQPIQTPDLPYPLPKPFPSLSSYPPPIVTYQTLNGYPPPIVTNPTPPLVIKETQATLGPLVTMTPYPTLIPFPTNTLKPGPSPTPIPLVLPAKDSAGTILFISKDRNSAKSALASLDVDFSGKPKSKATQISNYLIPNSDVYPSPDGQNIIFTIDTEGGPVGTILDVNSGKVGPILNGLHIMAFFNWYPDSNHILVELDGNGLSLIDVNSAEGTPLAAPRLGAIGGAAASPDGQQVIYSHVMGCCSPSELWIVNMDGRGAIKLFDSPYAAISFSWSPDGRKIAFYGDGLMVMNADGTDLHTVSHQPMHIGSGVPAIWSPDSRFLAIDTLQSPSPDKFLYDKSNIYLIDVVTGLEKPLLSDGKLGNLDPTWSPDGAQIAFVSTRSGTPELWMVNWDGTNLRQLTSGDVFLRFPFWFRSSH